MASLTPMPRDSSLMICANRLLGAVNGIPTGYACTASHASMVPRQGDPSGSFMEGLAGTHRANPVPVCARPLPIGLDDQAV
jgi:hypothetical protein